VKQDRRKGVEPIPSDLTALLTEAQINALPALEEKGVSLFAIRRPLFQESVVIMKFLLREGYGILLKDGTVDYFPDIEVRERPLATTTSRFSVVHS
jgi:hypothetical protein